jgi:hypothetical protein
VYRHGLSYDVATATTDGAPAATDERSAERWWKMEGLEERRMEIGVAVTIILTTMKMMMSKICLWFCCVCVFCECLWKEGKRERDG